MKRLASVAAALALSCSREPPAQPAPAPARRTGTGPAQRPPELTSAAFRSFADRHGKEVRHCYEAALQGDSGLRGKMKLQFTVQPSGAIDDVQVASTSFRTRAVPACVASVFRSWRTPFRPEEPVGIEYPLSFTPPR